MRNARDLMVKIGKIVNYVLLGLGALLFVLGIVGLILGAADSDSALAGSGGSCLGYGIWLLIANLVTLFIIGKLLYLDSYKSLFGILALNSGQ